MGIHGAQDVKISLALAYASGTADRTGAALDMSGYQGVMMVYHNVSVATGATTSIKAQSDTASAFGSPQDITGTAQTIADDDDGQIFVIDIENVPERYVRLYVDKDTSNAVAESAIYIQYGPDSKPTTMTVTDLVTHERHVAPAVGTA